MSLLEQIDSLREEAARLSALKREKRPLPPTIGEINAQATEYHNLLCTLEGVEAKIDVLLAQYVALPACPYSPCTGRLEGAPTKHVLRCTKCNAVTLPGRTQNIVIIGDFPK